MILMVHMIHMRTETDQDGTHMPGFFIKVMTKKTVKESQPEEQIGPVETKTEKQAEEQEKTDEKQAVEEEHTEQPEKQTAEREEPSAVNKKKAGRTACSA